MASMSDYLEDALIDDLFRTTTFSRPTNLWLALYTTSCDDASTGTTPSPGVEATGGAYVRLGGTDVDPKDANWAAPSSGDGVTSNLITLTFVTATASWTTINGLCIIDAATNGNIMFHGDVTTPRLIDNGDTAEYAIGSITCTLG